MLLDLEPFGHILIGMIFLMVGIGLACVATVLRENQIKREREDVFQRTELQTIDQDLSLIFV